VLDLAQINLRGVFDDKTVDLFQQYRDGIGQANDQ